MAYVPWQTVTTYHRVMFELPKSWGIDLCNRGHVLRSTVVSKTTPELQMFPGDTRDYHGI